MTQWKKANLPGQNERFLKLEERCDKMKINFDNLNAGLAALKIAVDDANKAIAALTEKVAQLSADNEENQAAVDAAAAAVNAEADKLPKADIGASSGGITA